MVIRVTQYTLDVADLNRMAAFWSAALGYSIDAGGDGSARLYPPPGAADAPTVWLQGSGTPKHGKNRLHLDLVADGNPGAEVDRLIALGARPANVGQSGGEDFTVLTDPEGNEFCVLHHPPNRP